MAQRLDGDRAGWPGGGMDLTCYLHPLWKPQIRPAPAERDWMSGTLNQFAYRCLPLNVANAHGWEILSPGPFEARWTGGAEPDALDIRGPGSTPPALRPTSVFGHGVLTFHIHGVFRTEPGWNLWVGGSPNRLKDAIQPLTGVVETDWSPYTFTMNWRFTRTDTWVKFETGEPVCFVFPVQRALLDDVQPRFVSFDDAPEVAEQFETWGKSRQAFHELMERNPPPNPADRWQKGYYRGVDAHGRPGPDDHQIKPRLKPFSPLGDKPASN